MKDNLIYTAINEILREHKINALWKKQFNPDIDGILSIDYGGYNKKFFVEIKKNLREFQKVFCGNKEESEGISASTNI